MHRSTVGDTALALLLFGVALWEVLAEPLVDDLVRGPPALNLAAIALVTLPLAARRVVPLAVTAAVFGAIAARALLAEPLELVPSFLATLIAAYSVAVYAGRWPSLLGLVLALAATEIAALQGSGGEASPDPVAAPVFLTAVWAVGRVAGSRHARARELARQAAERDRRREENARAAVAAERRRIALELHDAVSHSLALIVMQSAGRCRVAVTMRWQPATLELEVTNDGARSAGEHEVAPGRGLIGMRERAALVGGDLDVGHREDGDFGVHARLPLETAT